MTGAQVNDQLTQALFGALLRREAGLPLLVLIAVSALAGIAAAGSAAGLADAAVPTAWAGMVRRFHVTMLHVAGVLVVLRVAARTHEDHAAAWLVPLCTAGARRAFYPLAVAAVPALAMWLVFATGAGVFAAALLLHYGDGGVAAVLPRLLPAAALGLVCHALFTAIVAMILREPLAVVLVTFSLILLPYLLLAMRLLSGADTLSPAIELLIRATPSLMVPGSVSAWLGQVLLLAILALGAAVAGELRAGRYS